MIEAKGGLFMLERAMCKRPVILVNLAARRAIKTSARVSRRKRAFSRQEKAAQNAMICNEPCFHDKMEPSLTPYDH